MHAAHLDAGECYGLGGGGGLARAGRPSVFRRSPWMPSGPMDFIAKVVVVRDISLLMRARTVTEKESSKVLNKICKLRRVLALQLMHAWVLFFSLHV